MNRRKFLHTLLSGVAGSILSHELDIDRLLWVPGQRTIFIPSEAQKKFFMSHAEIVAIELERITPHLKSLFERDDTFYHAIRRKYEPE